MQKPCNKYNPRLVTDDIYVCATCGCYEYDHTTRKNGMSEPKKSELTLDAKLDVLIAGQAEQSEHINELAAKLEELTEKVHDMSLGPWSVDLDES